MGKTLREKAIMAMLGVVALYAFAVILWFVSAESSWKKAAKAYDKAKKTYQAEEKLIDEKQKWADAYENEKATMPELAEGKATDTKWLRELDRIAEKHNVVISTAQAGKEIEAGDVLELPIEVKTWEGSLHALVNFMYELLEDSEDGMYDITQLNFKPSSKDGYLRGSFTLNCAYMREK